MTRIFYIIFSVNSRKFPNTQLRSVAENATPRRLVKITTLRIYSSAAFYVGRQFPAMRACITINRFHVKVGQEQYLGSKRVLTPFLSYFEHISKT